MWQHWNSFWAPGPGDPPAVDDPVLWQSPWSSEQAIALQARNWEALLAASHSWWTMLLSAWPMTPTWPLPNWGVPQVNPVATAGIEPLVTKPSAQRKVASPAKRPAAAKGRSALQARKR